MRNARLPSQTPRIYTFEVFRGVQCFDPADHGDADFVSSSMRASGMHADHHCVKMSRETKKRAKKAAQTGNSQTASLKRPDMRHEYNVNAEDRGDLDSVESWGGIPRKVV